MRRTLVFTAVFGFLVLVLAVPHVFSTPIIRLQTLPQRQDAWNAGRIQPVSEWNNSFESHYPGMSPQLRPPNLAVMPDIPQEPDIPGLFIAWIEGPVGIKESRWGRLNSL